MLPIGSYVLPFSQQKLLLSEELCQCEEDKRIDRRSTVVHYSPLNKRERNSLSRAMCLKLHAIGHRDA